jgi:type I restriction enzyme S subunit
MKFEKLGNIVDIQKGKKPSFVVTPDENSVRVLQIDDLRNDNNPKYTNEKSGVYAKDDDVLIAWDGANAGTIGFGKSGYIGSTIALLRKKQTDIYSTAFLGIFLQSQYQYLRSKTTGATIPHISRKALEDLEVPVISMNGQLHIAHILSKAENLIAQRKESIRLLDEFLKSTFLEIFGDPVINEKKWKAIPFLNVGKFTSGGTPNKERLDFWNGDFPWVSPKDMKVSRIIDSQDHIASLVFQETTLKRIPRDHLLIVVRGMILAHSFPVAINEVDVAINQDMKAILPKSDLKLIYLQHCLNAMKRQILDLISSAGHGTKKIDVSAMRKLFIPVPPIELQTQFARIVEKTEALKAQYQQSLRELENLYGSLSQRAFRGELGTSEEKPTAAVF